MREWYSSIKAMTDGEPASAMEIVDFMAALSSASDRLLDIGSKKYSETIESVDTLWNLLHDRLEKAPPLPEAGNRFEIENVVDDDDFVMLVFHVDGHGRFGVPADEDTEELIRLIETVYKKAVSIEVKL